MRALGPGDPRADRTRIGLGLFAASGELAACCPRALINQARE